MKIDLDAIKARLAAPYAAGAYDITVRLADGRLCATVRMRDWDDNTAHEADAAVTRLLGNAPADLTALVAEVERLRGENSKLRDTLGWVETQCPGKCAGVCFDALSGEHRSEGGE
jgi:hypothetical protein